MMDFSITHHCWQSCCQHFWDLCHRIRSRRVLQRVGLQPACSLGEMCVDFPTRGLQSGGTRGVPAWLPHPETFSIQGEHEGTSAGGALLERHRSNLLLGLRWWYDRPLFVVCYVVSLLYDRLYVTVPLLPKYMTIIIQIRVTLYATI